MEAFQRLAEALGTALAGEVCFDAATRAAYASDASNYRQVPVGVVLPRSVEDVVAAVALCRSHGAALLPRGAGTSMCGQSVNAALVVDCSKYLDRVLEVNAAARTARVEPGTVCDALCDAAAAHALTFAPDPATHSRCTLGGMIGNNSCGPHSVMAGKTVENIERLEVLTYDGARFWCGPTGPEELRRIVSSGGRQAEIYTALHRIAQRYENLIRERFPKIRRRVSGYNLDELLPERGFNVARALVGSEGTCALTLQAEVRLVKRPRHRVLVVRGFPDVFAAGDAVPEVLAAGPTACEGLDEAIIGGLRARGLRGDDIALLPPGKAWLMVEFGGDSIDEAVARARRIPGTLIEDANVMTRLWTLRETAASATALNLGGLAPDPIVGWEDAAVDPSRLGDYLREFSRLVARFGYRTSIYGHFGDGCVHARINFDLRTEKSVAHWREFLREASLLVVKYGGSLSGEHGDGHARAEFLPLMFGAELMQALREFKAAWDPQNRMNPGKIVDPFRVDEHLRLGPQYKPVTLQTRFAFRTPEGEGFARAVGHCVGMGKCRASKGGTMCPSYRATREERYSTRGRARLLAEMLRGELITNGWQSEAVKDALDWCLACKGCRSDCPTHTDMAAYKAEFMSHYYESHRRPRQAWTMGRLAEWAPLAGLFPSLANRLSNTVIAKHIAGVAPERSLPKFAPKTFRATFASEQRGEPVVLFDDCFNNYFRPATARAGQAVLERAGCAVELAPARVCCGRPYYDFGMLDHARRALERVLQTLAPQLERGLKVVVLEPGCLSVFRDEIHQLFPHDERALRLAGSVVSLAELLNRRGYRATLQKAIVMHAHCHQKALWGTADDIAVLKRAGAELATPDTGCCGMAGSFGYRPQFLEASRRIAELALLPALQAAPEATVLASGFSCREQIEALARRRTLHIAEVLAGE